MNEDQNVKPTFLDKVTTVPAPWANTVSSLVYDVFKKATNVLQARAALGLGTLASQNFNSVSIIGGQLNSVSIGLGIPGPARFTTAMVTVDPTDPRHAVNLRYLNQRLGNLPDVIDALGEYVQKNNANLTGIPVVPTPTGANKFQIANIEYITNTVIGLIGQAPTSMNSISKLANALGNNPNFGTLITEALSKRLRVDTNEQGLSSAQKINAVTNLGLATVATSGDYNDLRNLPAGLTRNYEDLDGLPVFASVAFTGNYAQLKNIPTTFVRTDSFNSYTRTQLTQPVIINNAQGGILLDLKLTNVFNINAIGPVTLNNPSFLSVSGARIRIVFKQNNTGGQTLTLGSKFVFDVDEPAFVPSLAPNSITEIIADVDGVTQQLLCKVKRYQAAST